MRKSPFPKFVPKGIKHYYTQIDIRIRKVDRLYRTAEDFMIKNPTNLNKLVDMLLDDSFSHSQYTDPEYPM